MAPCVNWPAKLHRDGEGTELLSNDEVDGIDHDLLRLGTFTRQRGEDPVEHA